VPSWLQAKAAEAQAQAAAAAAPAQPSALTTLFGAPQAVSAPNNPPDSGQPSALTTLFGASRAAAPTHTAPSEPVVRVQPEPTGPVCEVEDLSESQLQALPTDVSLSMPAGKLPDLVPEEPYYSTLPPLTLVDDDGTVQQPLAGLITSWTGHSDTLGDRVRDAGSIHPPAMVSHDGTWRSAHFPSCYAPDKDDVAAARRQQEQEAAAKAAIVAQQKEQEVGVGLGWA
jgi:hypothetical protein